MTVRLQSLQVAAFLQLMFNNSADSLFKKGVRDQQCINDYQKKNVQFHKNIRKQQIEEKMKRMREEILASLSEDYHFLKGINLNNTLHAFTLINQDQIAQNWESIDKLTNDMFIYSRSDQSDHLHYLFDDRTILKLTQLLQPTNIEQYYKNPRTYIRILWIIANYTAYTPQTIAYYNELLFNIELCKDIFFKLFEEITSIAEFYALKREYKIFTHSQAKQIMQIILFSINNLSQNVDILLGVCFQPTQQTSFLHSLTRECQKLITFTQCNSIEDTFIPPILFKILNIFEKVLKLDLDCQQAMNKIYQLDYKLITMLLQLLSTVYRQEKQKEIEYQIIIILRQYLYVHLYSKPEIIIKHNFTILFEMFSTVAQRLITLNHDIFNYYNLLDIEGVVKPSLESLKNNSNELEKLAIQLLETFVIIFGLNIPDENEDEYYERFERWLDDKMLPVFRKLFKINDSNFDNIRYNIMLILSNFCLEESFCDRIIEELPIMNKIFYSIHSDSIGILTKKAALSVLNSIICIALQGQSHLRWDVVEMLQNNKAIAIFANYLGEYADEELNKNLLHSLSLFLRTQTAEEAEDHTLWAQFCCQGGLFKLERYYSVISNREIQLQIQAVLDEYKCS